MKKTFIVLLCLLTLTSLKAISQGYEIKIKFTNLKDTNLFLGLHYGNNKYIKDTTRIDKKGVAVFKGKTPLAPGIYLIITPSRNYFEILVREPLIYIEADTTDLTGKIKVITSEENKRFYEYLAFMETQYENRQKLMKDKDKVKDNKEESDKINEQLKQIDDTIIGFRKYAIKTYPNLFFGKLMKMMEEPEPREKLEGESDSIYGQYLYNFYQEHFFDNFDFSDSAILRTPIYEARLDRFVDKMVMKNPDSVKCSVSRVIDKSLANREVFKFTCIKFFNKYANEMNTYMGIDAIFFHLAKRYYLSGLAYWSDSTQMKKIADRVWNLENNLIGMKAKELILIDTNNNYRSLYQTKAIYTVVIFWDVSCGHCKHEMPIIRDLYHKMGKDSLQIFAVHIGDDDKEWKKYIKEQNMDFIHVHDPQYYSNFRQYYDVYKKPIIYLLDKNKVIQAKNIPADKLVDLIAFLNKNPVPEKKRGDSCEPLPAPKPLWK
ncbi:MAG TPA: DUF5106 domain-containing protein [Bacteroidia bacterium]|nr:DUF5106 domain-containing protein [Bacteroidia bacterium]HRS57605.1 DUF5106 domain-containing protein [Bacteroidia bacterium]HRU67191.1 DUF5106 domain-containing protein [Bacteroidia bacterium]